MGIASWAIKKTLNAAPQVQRLGFVESVDVDSDRRVIVIEATLKGETYLTRSTVHYDIFGNDFVIQKVEVNRPWLEAIADYYLSNENHKCFAMQNALISGIVKFLL